MHGIEDAGEVGGVEEAGRAATEINGVEMRGRCRAKPGATLKAKADPSVVRVSVLAEVPVGNFGEESWTPS